MGASAIGVPLVYVLFLGPAAPPVTPSGCEARAQEIFHHKAIRVGGNVREPRKLRHVISELPRRKTPTRGAEPQVWEGDVLIDPEGNVRQVFVIRDLVFDPPWPELGSSITAAILQWKYAPTVVDKTPVPVCMKVTTSVQWPEPSPP